MPFAHVPGELRKPMQSALRIPQRREHHVGPKPRAVFADSPSFVHVLAALGCFRQCLFWLAIHHIFWRIKHGKVLSDDFIRAVAFQAFGAGIPANHVPKGVQLENRIFLHRLDQQAEAFLAIPHSLFRSLAIRNVFKGHSHKMAGKRKYIDGINALANALIPVGYFA